MFYKINDIYQVKIKETGKKYWLLKQGNEYKDFLYNRGLTVNKKDVNVIQSFSTFLNENGLETMVLVQGCDSGLITKQLVIDVLNMRSDILSMSDEEYNRIDIISKTVGNMCCLTLVDNCESFSNDTFKDKYRVLNYAKELLTTKSLRNLLNQAIRLELIKNRNTDIQSSIGKSGLYIDYKIASIFNTAGIKYDLNWIKDFKIVFDGNAIEQYDENDRCCFSSKFGKNKIKTIDKK